MSNWSKKSSGPLFIPTNSSATASISGMAMIYAKSDGKLYTKNTNGTESEVPASGSGGGGGGTNPIMREYTANDTWTKPSAANFYAAIVVCIGAGGGGGSGRKGALSSAKSGGAGGAGGAMVTRYIQSQYLSSSISITVGSGGNGGSYVTANSTNGNNGSTGGDTSFGNLVIAKGGSGGGAGSTTANSTTFAGRGNLCTPSGYPYALSGASGGRSQVSTTAAVGIDGFATVTYGSPTSTAMPGGGGGGGASTANAYYDGAAGGGILNNSGSITAGPAGGSTTVGSIEGGHGTGNQYKRFTIFYDFNTPLSNGVGSGGGGGGCAPGLADPGNGGNGGLGSGGGGGGAQFNDVTSIKGSGGSGGNGLCYVLEIYG